MRRREKKQIEEFIHTLCQAHEEVKSRIEHKDIGAAQEILGNCQDGALQIGSLIETVEGEACAVIPKLEVYCELVFQVYEGLGETWETGQNAEEKWSIETERSTGEIEADRIYTDLQGQLSEISQSVRDDIPERLEILFLPYKASMWDSLESIWKAAYTDENCDAYVVPIPYYDRNPDGSMGKYHYEGIEFPPYVPVTPYADYDLEKRRPDIIYIHNPYDDHNFVTSVDPAYYSSELKKYTDLLVYIPYYSTAGGMSEAQASCPAYYNADYIVIQAEKYRKFFDPALPHDKLQPLGSPKFDRVVHICNNPPEPPAGWKEKMRGKKVYFYNTSLQGMLGDTEAFLKKMRYVFECFIGREDACLLWRPHPLLESSMETMRARFKPLYDALKTFFIEHDLGIYDDTPDMTSTIALCDAYIGDSGTSVTSLFGIVGKPLFILDNNIDTEPEPEEEDWRGKTIPGFSITGDNAWMITPGNKLYHSANNDYKYRYFCDLSEYASGNYYSQVITIGERHYVCPANARDIIVIHDDKVEKKIVLEQCIEQAGAFYGAISCGKYLFLIPCNYPVIVRYDTENDEVKYILGHIEVFNRVVEGERRLGGFCVQGEYLYLASPADNQVLVIHAETGREGIATVPAKQLNGCMTMVSDGTNLWLLPFSGYVITRWNPDTGEVREYTDYPKQLKCTYIPHGFECEERAFASLAFCGDYVYLAPYWANMHVRLNKKTGMMTEWRPPFEMPDKPKNGYYMSWGRAYFLPVQKNGAYHFYSVMDRKLYHIDLETEKYDEILIDFDVNELRQNEPGFKENSEWLQYVCDENTFNTLTDFLDGNIMGEAFDKEKQIRAYSKIAANNDGTCGEKTHQFICRQLRSCCDAEV